MEGLISKTTVNLLKQHAVWIIKESSDEISLLNRWKIVESAINFNADQVVKDLASEELFKYKDIDILLGNCLKLDKINLFEILVKGKLDNDIIEKCFYESVYNYKSFIYMNRKFNTNIDGELLSNLYNVGWWDWNLTKNAVTNKDMRVFKFLIENKCPWSNSVVLTAIKNKNIDVLEYLYNLNKDMYMNGIFKKNNHKYLTDAIKTQSYEIIKWCLDHGSIVKQRHLIIIAKYYNLDSNTTSEYLLNINAILKLISSRSTLKTVFSKVIITCIKNKNPYMMKYFLKITLSNKNDVNYIYRAFKYNSKICLLILIKQGYTFKSKNHEGLEYITNNSTPQEKKLIVNFLFKAGIYNSESIVNFIMERIHITDIVDFVNENNISKKYSNIGLFKLIQTRFPKRVASYFEVKELNI